MKDKNKEEVKEIFDEKIKEYDEKLRKEIYNLTTVKIAEVGETVSESVSVHSEGVQKSLEDNATNFSKYADEMRVHVDNVAKGLRERMGGIESAQARIEECLKILQNNFETWQMAKQDRRY